VTSQLDIHGLRVVVRARNLGLFAAALAAVVLLTSDAQASRLKVCTFAFNAPDEIEVFKRRLPAHDFEILDFSKRFAERSPSSTAVSRLVDICSPDLKCDIVVYSAEFAGRFFGERGTSIGIHELEEASCHPSCRGLFHDPSEVFLLGCNTLATKDRDERTPAEYRDVLLRHGFDPASAEHAVQLRYGPLGPSFRQSVRRIFAGVPRIYGFDSVAPRAQVSATLLESYFGRIGNYARYLSVTKDSTQRNSPLHAAYAKANFTQLSGLQASEPAERDGQLLCALYDEHRTVGFRLRIIESLSQRSDFLAYVPTMKVFFARHPPATLSGPDRKTLSAVTNQRAARDRVLRLVRDSDMSAVTIDLAQLAYQLNWMTRGEFNRLALQWTRKAIALPTSDAVDVSCELAQLVPLGSQLAPKDFPSRLYRDPEGVRLLDCLAPPHPEVSEQLAKALDGGTAALRLWITYALSRRGDLSDDVLLTLANHVDDGSAELRDGLRWVMSKHTPLPREVREVVAARNPELAGELGAETRGRQVGVDRRGRTLRPPSTARANNQRRNAADPAPAAAESESVYALEGTAFRSSR
jgi:hypothetical protein